MADLKIACICFNKFGAIVAERVHDTVKKWEEESERDIKLEMYIRNAINLQRDLFTSLEVKTDDWTAERFVDTDIIIYICPSVQAVKHISKSISDQMSDPAVLVIDEKGKYCVPLLAGRRGEANEFGEMLQRKMDVVYVNPLIDDARSRLDVEEYAAKSNMVISNTDYAKEITAALESGHEVGFYTNFPVLGAIPDKFVWSSEAPLGIYVSPSYHTAYFDHTLWLIPRCLAVGVLCDSELSYKTVRKIVVNALQSLSLYPEAISKFATIKGHENNASLQSLALERAVPILSFEEEELRKIPSSDGSVLDTVEAAALKASEGKLIINTYEEDGVTVAVAMENIYIKF